MFMYGLLVSWLMVGRSWHDAGLRTIRYYSPTKLSHLLLLRYPALTKTKFSVGGDIALINWNCTLQISPRQHATYEYHIGNINNPNNSLCPRAGGAALFTALDDVSIIRGNTENSTKETCNNASSTVSTTIGLLVSMITANSWLPYLACTVHRLHHLYSPQTVKPTRQRIYQAQ